MAHKKTGRRRGRPIDEGTTQLQAKKLRATTRADIELTGAGILFGCGHLDRQQYDVLDQIAAQPQLITRGWGISTGGVSGL